MTKESSDPVSIADTYTSSAIALTERVAGQLRNAFPQDSVKVIGELMLRITSPGGIESELSLENLRRQCAKDPAECDAEIEHFVMSRLEREVAPQTRARASVRPALRVTESLKHFDETDPRRHLAGDLWVTYVFDSDKSMESVSRADMEALKLNPESIHDLAMANLARAFPGPLPIKGIEGTTISIIETSDSYGAARLLLYDRWRALAQTMAGELIVSAPSRDFVLVTPNNDLAQLLTIQKTATDALAKTPYPLSSKLFRLTPTGWVEHEPAQP